MQPALEVGHLKGMKTRKATILLILAVSALSFADTWTLDACLKQAKAKSLSLESAKLREQQAEINIQQSKVGNRPTVSASIQIGRASCRERV